MLIEPVVSGAPITSFQVFGERCSGTNFLEALIERNFPDLAPACIRKKGEVCIEWRYGWKHGFPGFPVPPDGPLFISVFRHPETWLSSLFRNPWHVPVNKRAPTFSEFIRAPWLTVAENDGIGGGRGSKNYGKPLLWDRDPVTAEPFKTPMHLRNAKNSGFLSLGRRGFDHAILLYEDVANHPEECVAQLAETFGLRRLAQFDAVATYKGRSTNFERQSAPWSAISDPDRSLIWSELDEKVEASLGYEPL